MYSKATVILLVFMNSWLNAFPKFPNPQYDAGIDGCLLVYDLKQEKVILREGGSACESRYPACSTFKVPLALMAFDAGILLDPDQVWKWDKTPRALEAWNQDQTPRTWMRDSVVWLSQVFTVKLGSKLVTQYLKDFGFGNADMSGGIGEAWLTRSRLSASPPTTTLLISPDEQLDFLKKLYQNRLSLKGSAVNYTRAILRLESTDSKTIFSGKTGSGFPDFKSTKASRLGWFVGHVQSTDQEFLVVNLQLDRREKPPYEFGGSEARKWTKAYLQKAGLL